MKEFEILDAIARMAKDNNQGVLMSTTIVEAKPDPRGAIVSFGVTKEVGDDAKLQSEALPTKYLTVCFAINRDEYAKYKSDTDALE